MFVKLLTLNRKGRNESKNGFIQSCDRITETQSLTVYKNAFVFFPFRNACVGHYVDGNHIHFIIILSAHQRRIIEFFYLISQSGRKFSSLLFAEIPLLESLSPMLFS